MPVIEQKTTNKNKVDFDLNRLDKSKTTIFSKYPKSLINDIRKKALYLFSDACTVPWLLIEFYHDSLLGRLECHGAEPPRAK